MKNRFHIKLEFFVVLICLSSGIAFGQSTVSNKIKILNFGTFHMRYTPDANTVEFDERDKKNKEDAHKIAKMISEFKPTVILVEIVPEKNQELQASYNEYLNNPDKTFENPSEVELLAFEVGRLSGTKRVYGINHKLGYNYKIGQEIVNSIDSITYNDFLVNPFHNSPELNKNLNSLSLIDKFRLLNNGKFLDFLIETNADILTFAGTDDNFEGADEASKYYQRNLRMFSNLNRIDLKKDDRVFILMGASHTAFFRDFIGRSPKYIMVDTFDYLK